MHLLWLHSRMAAAAITGTKLATSRDASTFWVPKPKLVHKNNHYYLGHSSACCCLF